MSFKVERVIPIALELQFSAGRIANQIGTQDVTSERAKVIFEKGEDFLNKALEASSELEAILIGRATYFSPYFLDNRDYYRLAQMAAHEVLGEESASVGSFDLKVRDFLTTLRDVSSNLVIGNYSSAIPEDVAQLKTFCRSLARISREEQPKISIDRVIIRV